MVLYDDVGFITASKDGVGGADAYGNRDWFHQGRIRRQVKCCARLPKPGRKDWYLGGGEWPNG